MLRLLKVTGDSLSPEYQEGDFVLVCRILLLVRAPKSGDVVVFRHPAYGTMIKLVDRVAPEGDEIFVVGTHDDSVDSRQFGPISRKALLGKVIWHIKKPDPLVGTNPAVSSDRAKGME